MRKLYYYAVLDNDNICIDIVTKTRKTDLPNHIEIFDYNESLFYKKYDEETGWSQETYEPNIPNEVKEKLEKLEEELKGKDTAIQDLKNEFNKTQGTDKIVLSSIFNIDTRLLAIEEKLKGSEK